LRFNTSPDTTLNDSAQTAPVFEPYSSDKSVGQHILAFPSYLLHWTTRPIGWGIKWAEIKLPQLLQGDRAPYGIYPLFELGGDVGIAYGLLLYHNQFLKYDHQVRIEALFGSEEYNDFDFEYTIPSFISNTGRINFDASYSNDPVKSLFGNNRSSLKDEQLYATEEIEGAIEYENSISNTAQISFSTRYWKMAINNSERNTEDPFPVIPQNLRGTTRLLSIGSALRFDFVKGNPRTFRGSRYIAGLEWNHSLTDDRFHYLIYNLEWQQFIPLPFLPNSRRLAFKTSLQKAAPLGDKKIPFFDKPSLGSSSNLRGFSSDRYRDDGSLLLTLEYRYPMWNFADIVFFVDEGQVFNRYSDIAINDFHTSYGFGFHLISTKGFAFRSEFAFSRESSRVILTIKPNF
jgi:outer membrane protein assembly factor BamA